MSTNSCLTYEIAQENATAEDSALSRAVGLGVVSAREGTGGG